MRTLLILLVAMTAWSTGTPQAAAGRMPRRAAPMVDMRAAMPAGGCHDACRGLAHVCLGCAVTPDAPSAPGGPAPGDASRLVGAAPGVLAGRRPAFDPPPPRLPG